MPWTRAHTRLHSPSHSLNARSCCTALRRLRPHHCRACEGRGRGTSRTVLFCDAGQHPSARVCHAHAIRPVPRVMMHHVRCVSAPHSAVLCGCATSFGARKRSPSARSARAWPLCTAPLPLRAPLRSAPHCVLLRHRADGRMLGGRTHARALTLTCADGSVREGLSREY